MRLLSTFFISSTAILAVAPASAADWLGTVSADWFTAGNWNPNAVPVAGTAVTINNAATPNPATINAPGALAGRVDLGSAGGQSGTLNVAGGTLAATSLFAGILGTGTVNITNGGLLSTTGTATAADSPNSTGTITATGTNSRFNPGSLFIAADANTNGQVNITNGASLTTGGTTIGFFTSTATGILTVSNATMTTGAMTIGERGNGTFNLNGGSTGTSTGFSTIGSSNATGVGAANIAGAGTTWASGSINIGTIGTGALAISSGAKVTSTSSNTVVPAISLGGTATVTGAGSQWDIVGNSAGTSQGVLGIGSKANTTATFTVSDGGKVSIRDGAPVTNGQFMQLRMGISANSTGSLTVTGANSSFTTPFDVYTGFNAGTTGNITVSNGGALSTGNAQLGASGTGNALVTGAGSVWTILDTPSVPGSHPRGLTIGGSAGSNGTLTIADGGTLNVNSTGPIAVTIGSAGGSSGTLNIGAAAANPAAAAGTLNAANVVFSTGATGTLNFNHTSNNYLFAPSISGTGPGTVNFLSGKTIVSGNNTYTGATNVSAGATAQFGNGGANGLITGNVTNNGAVAVNLSSSATYAGVISGGGTFEKLGSNTLSLSGTNTYSGGTTISAGTLNIGAAGTTGSITGNIVNNSILAFNRSNSFTFSNLISGTGSVDKRGAGTVTLTAANTYTGGTSVSQGTLRLGSSNRLASTGSLFVFAGATFDLAGFSQTVGAFSGPGTAAIGAGSLIAGNELDRTFQGSLTGSGSFIKQGTGSLTMSGNSAAYTGTTTVNNGLLAVNGNLSNSNTTVNAGGTLGGTGTVGRTTVSGTVAPGNSIGTLNVNGPYVQNAGSFYNVEVNAAGQSDLINVNGTATINGGTVRVLASLGAFNPTTVYTILTSTGARTGTYDAVTSNFAFLAPELTYDFNNVYLTLTRNSLEFAAIGNTPNQRATGSGVELLGLTNPLVLAALFLNPDQARDAFDRLSGEIHPSLRTAMIEDSRFIRDAVLGRLSQISATPSLQPSTAAIAAEDAEAALGYAKRRRTTKAQPKWPIAPQPAKPVYSAWAHGYGNWAQRDGDGNAAAIRYNTGGGFGGVDVTLNNRWRFGFVAGGGSTSASVAARASNGTIDTAHMGVYGGTQVGAFAFKGGLAYARHDVTTSRTIVFGTFGDFARASYHGSTSQAFGEAAWRVPVARLSLETFANVAYVRASTGGFAEAGGPAALSVAGTSSETAYTTLGIRGSKVFAGAPWPVVVAASLGWQHAWTHSAPLSAMTFAGSPGPFAIAGVPIAADALAAEASADALISPNAMLGVSYSGRVAGAARSHAAKGRFVYQF